jgi:hypothetical protein
LRFIRIFGAGEHLTGCFPLEAADRLKGMSAGCIESAEEPWLRADPQTAADKLQNRAQQPSQYR